MQEHTSFSRGGVLFACEILILCLPFVLSSLVTCAFMHCQHRRISAFPVVLRIVLNHFMCIQFAGKGSSCGDLSICGIQLCNVSESGHTRKHLTKSMRLCLCVSGCRHLLFCLLCMTNQSNKSVRIFCTGIHPCTSSNPAGMAIRSVGHSSASSF